MSHKSTSCAPSTCFEMSHAQKSMWLHQQIAPESPFYNNPAIVQLHGNVNLGYIENTLQLMLKRHEALRTTFKKEANQFIQTVSDQVSVPVTYLDLRFMSSNRAKAAEALVKREISTPFHLATGPLIRVSLYQFEDDRWYFVINMHHIISDAWSWRIFFKEFLLIYKGLTESVTVQLPAMISSYLTYTAQQDEYHQTPAYLRKEAFWIKHLHDIPILKFPPHKKAPKQRFVGKKKRMDIPQPLAEQIKQLCQERLISPFVYFLTLFQLQLFLLTDQPDFGIGVPFANRTALEVESLIGLFINMVVLRNPITHAMSFDALLEKTQDTVLSAYENQEVPFETLINKVQFVREANFDPLFQVMFIFQDSRYPQESHAGFTLQHEFFDNRTCVSDFLLEVIEFHDTLSLCITYHEALFSESFIEACLSHYLNLAAYCAEHGSLDLSIIKDHLITPQQEQDGSAEENRPPLTVYHPPRTNIEQVVSELWSELLSVTHPSIHESFFAMGGNSLIAIRFISRIKTVFGIELPLITFFEQSTIAGIAACIEQKTQIALPIIKKRDATTKEQTPLSFSQQRLWFLSKLHPHDHSYHVSGYLVFKGNLRADFLASAVNAIIERHDILRTNIHTHQDEPIQKTAPFEVQTLPIVNSTPAAFDNILQTETRLAFDLSHGPLFRFKLVRINDQLSYLILCAHHIVFDGWSFRVFFKELSILYTKLCLSDSNRLPSLEYQYSDYAHFQNTHLKEKIKEQTPFWLKQLEQAEQLALPLDKARKINLSNKAGRQVSLLSTVDSNTIQRFSQQHQVSVFTVLLSAFFIMLQKLSGQTDLMIGIPVAGRDHLEFEALIGLFINTLVIREQVEASSTGQELIHALRKTLLDAYTHANVPFDHIIETLQIERDLRKHPLVQVMFNYINIEEIKIEMPDLLTEAKTVPSDQAKYDLNFIVSNEQGRFKFEMEFNEDLFFQASIAAYLDYYQLILSHLIASPEQNIAAIPPQTAMPPLKQSISLPVVALPCSDLIAAFKHQVAQYPAHTAIQTPHHQLTYATLDNWSNSLAQAILLSSNPTRSPIGILTRHDEKTVVAMLGALKTAAPYVILDPNHPLDWLSEIVRNSDCSHIIHTDETAVIAHKLPPARLISVDQIGKDDPINIEFPVIQPDHIAYILYTSGSTGTPKGVVQTHRNVCFHAFSYLTHAQLTPHSQMFQLAPFGYDAAVLDVYGSLLSGGCIVTLSLQQLGLLEVIRFLQESTPTHLHSTPTVFRTLLYAIEHLPPTLQTIILGGEATTEADLILFRQKARPNCSLVSLYGSTECSFAALQVFSSDSMPDQKDSLHMGTFIDGVHPELWDENQQPTPFFGELVLRSTYLAKGYWKNDHLTQRAFMNPPASTHPDQTPPTYGYKTGDLVRRLPSGQLAFVRRKDKRVKIRGHLVETDQIEAILRKLPMMETVAVVDKVDNAGDVFLSAYMQPQQTKEKRPVLSSAEIQALLREQLPEYMIPSYLHYVDQMPLNRHGKTNRPYLSQLKEEDITSPASGDHATLTPLQQSLLDIWQKVLKKQLNSIDKNFFEIGGNSLLLIVLHSNIQQQIAKPLSLVDLFKFPTIRLCAQYLEAEATLPLDNSMDIATQRRQALAMRRKHLDKALL